MPPELEGQAAQTQDVTQTQGQADVSAQGQATQTTAATSDPTQTTQGTQAAAAQTATAAALGLRDQLVAAGVDVSGYADDAAAVQAIAQLYRQLPQVRQLAMLGEQVYPHYSQFRTYLQEQQARAQQAQAQQPAPWFKAPEYDPSWAAKLQRDPATGKIVPADGAPPDLVTKWTAWQEHRQQFLDRFSQDPIAAIRPGVEQLVQSLLGPAIQQAVSQQQEQRRVESLIAQNSDWIYQRDAQGNQQYDHNGQKVLTVWGQRYRDYANQAAQMGIASSDHQHSYAFGMVERDFHAARARAQAQGQQQQGQAAKEQFVNGARHMPNVGSQHAQGVNGAPAQGAAGPINTQKDLEALLRQRMTAAGYTNGRAAETR